MLHLISAFLTPLLWPFPHVIRTLLITGKEPKPKLTAPPYFNLESNMAVFGGAMRSFLIAVFIVYGLYDGDNYPAFGRAFVFSWSWMWPILVRNLIGTWLICGFWDWWLYFGPLHEKLFKYKIIQKYPTKSQMRHDVFWTTLSSCFAAVIEWLLCHWWATGTIPMARSLNERPILHLVLALTLTHWRVPHFHLMHRSMHPWKTEIIPDFGKMLYKMVHSLHHKSSNITAFSGTNMHPVESTIYYTAAFVCLPLGLHPCMALAVIVDCALGAWLSHDGFVFPGSGDYYHSLHHMHFDCNYGGPHIPLDLLFGTYAGSKEDVGKIWGRKPAGRDANETYVHDDSKSNKVE